MLWHTNAHTQMKYDNLKLHSSRKPKKGDEILDTYDLHTLTQDNINNLKIDL